ncbi:MAG: histidine kinase, partial [Cyanobacteriota bacterium]|nr:histidine kinase [Cyanobacteriota bacterium]
VGQFYLLSATLQPHFLMNALNTLIACRHDPEAVEAAGEGLAGNLRDALDRRSGELEPLAVQLEARNLVEHALKFGQASSSAIHCARPFL